MEDLHNGDALMAQFLDWINGNGHNSKMVQTLKNIFSVKSLLLGPHIKPCELVWFTCFLFHSDSEVKQALKQYLDDHAEEDDEPEYEDEDEEDSNY